MAMTKKEKAELDALRAELARTRALRWSDHKPPLMLPIPTGLATVRGWLYNACAGRVFRAWSDSVCHGEGWDTNRSASQRGVPLYATRRDAVIALRLELQSRFAETLAHLDELAEDTAMDTEISFVKGIR